MQNTIVVTRHPALVAYLIRLELISPDTPVLAHAKPEDIAGKHVIGVLPVPLAALCERVTMVPLRVPAELRGQELTVEQVALYAGEVTSYRVTKIA